MAISAYTGLPGSGKSYGVVENVILPALKSGRRIFTNIPMNQELIEESYGGLVTQFKSADVLDNPDWFQDVFQPGATLIIDECWRIWAAGLKANNMSEKHKSFLAEHRHMVGSDGQSTEIVFVTQDLAQIASYPRSLVETTYRAVKLNAIGASKKFRIDVYEGCVTGQRPPATQFLRRMYSSYSSDIYKWYTSQTMSDSTTHGDESTSDKRNNILNGSFFKFGLPGLAVFACAIMYFGWQSVSGMYATPADDEVAVSSPVAPGKVVRVEKPPEDQSHFYDDTTANIIYTTGVEPFQTFTLMFASETGTVTLMDSDLGKMGYTWIAYDSCYGQLTKASSTLHVFCKADAPDVTDQDISTPNPLDLASAS
jgi:zona occludens toxin